MFRFTPGAFSWKFQHSDAVNRRFHRKHQSEIFAEKPKIFAENSRKPQIGVRHLRSVTLSAALLSRLEILCMERAPTRGFANSVLNSFRPLTFVNLARLVWAVFLLENCLDRRECGVGLLVSNTPFSKEKALWEVLLWKWRLDLECLCYNPGKLWDVPASSPFFQDRTLWAELCKGREDFMTCSFFTCSQACCSNGLRQILPKTGSRDTETTLPLSSKWLHATIFVFGN